MEDTVPSDLDIALQCTVRDGPYDIFEDFIKALNGNKPLIEKYNRLKQEWHGKSMADYRAAKAKFIEKVLNRVQ